MQAQGEAGWISGSVSDPSQSVVAGAKVVAREVHTQSLRVTFTDNEGFYSVAQLQTGEYEVSIEVPGFTKFVQRVQVTVGARITVDARLSLSPVETQVVVLDAGGVQVETQTPMLSEVVNEQQITELPSLTRNPYDFVGLAGNTSPGDPSGRGVGFAINGQRAASTSITLDGVENADLFSATLGLSVPLDSVKEFRLSESTFTAEYGRASGGMVDVQTRSGTNDFHGTAYEFNRVSALAANTFGNNARGFPRGVFTRNQFGYAVGGPILKGRLFFFQSTEWTRIRSHQTIPNLVPTPQFIAAADPATQAYMSAFGGTANPINGPLITKADILSAGIQPNPGGPFDLLPPGTPIFGQAAFTTAANAGGGDPQNAYSLVGRLDFNATQNTKLFGRFALQKGSEFPGTFFSSPYPGYDTSITGLNKNALLGLTHVFSPSLVSETKLGWSRLDQQTPLGTAPPGPALFFPGTSFFGVPVMLPGYGFNPMGTTQYQWQIHQDVSWTLGKHLLRAGGEFFYYRLRLAGLPGQVATQLLGNQTPDALDNFLLGQITQFEVAIDPQGKFPCVAPPNDAPVVTPGCTLALPLQSPRQVRISRNRDGAGYVQDTWRALKRLTLTLGLRWEYYGVQYSKDPSQESNFYLGPGSSITGQIRTGQVFTVPNSPIHNLWNPDYNNFGPRIGFAWDVLGNGTTSLRGGYGISYERNFGFVFQNLSLNPPSYAIADAFAGTPQFPALPVTTANLGPFAGSAGSIVYPDSIARQVDANIKTAYAETWSLSIDRQLLPNTVLSISYTGSHGVNLYTDNLTDSPGAGVVYGGDDPAVNPFSTLSLQYGNITTRGNGASSIYHALLVSVRGQNVKNTGLTFTANYTWAHSIDNLSSTLSESPNNTNIGFLDFLNPALDRGDSQFDNRHHFVASAIWQIPYFATSTHRWQRVALGGWSIAPIFSAVTGITFSIADCTYAFARCPRYIPSAAVSTTGHAVDTGKPNFFSYIPLTPAVPYFNPLIGISDFGDCSLVPAPPCPFPANMTRRDQFRTPGLWNLNLGIYKNFKLHEAWTLQFRAELFDAFNHANLEINEGQAEISTNPDFVSAKRFGARNIQLALKLTF